MNMNLNLNLNIETLKALLPVLRKAQPYLYGVALIGIFGYTAYALNAALNVQAAATQTEIQALPAIKFDQKTIANLKTLTAVNGQVPLDNLGKDDPFKP